MAQLFDTWRSGGTGRGPYTLTPRTTGEIPLTIDLLAGQTANGFQVRNSAGTTLFSVDPSGNITIAGNISAVVDEVMTGDLQLTGDLTVNGNTTLGNVSGDTISVLGTATFSTPTTFSGTITANDTTRFNATTSGTTHYLRRRSATPSIIEDSGGLYTLAGDVGTTELFYIDGAGNTVQITDAGALEGSSLFWDDDEYIRMGNTAASPDVRIGWNTTQTVDGWYFGTADGQNTLIFAENGDRTYDFAHGAQTNPTVFVHSAAQSTTQWLSLAHDQTNAIIGSGLGDIEFRLPNDRGLLITDATADASLKEAIIKGQHYTNAEQNVLIMAEQSTVTATIIDYGGGNGLYNSATRLSFYTAADNITVTGTERIRVNSTGVVIIGAGEGGTTIATGNTFRAPDLITGGAGNIAAADLTIGGGLGTGTGDPSQIIFQVSTPAAAGDTLQSRSTVFTLDGDTGSTVLLVQPVATSGSPTVFTLTGGAHTTLTASTEATDINFDLTRTVQFATGALTTQRAIQIGQPTYGFVAASTISTAITAEVAGPPRAGTNATITNSYGLVVGRGDAANPVDTASAAMLSVNMPDIASGFGAMTNLVGFELNSNAVQLGNQTATLDFFGGMNLTAVTLTSDTLVRTVTTATTLNVEGPPIASTNVTITNPARAVLIGGSAVTQGTAQELLVSTGQHTGMTASTEAAGVQFALNATKQWATGAMVTQREFIISAPTYGFVGASTITAAYTVDIDRPPRAGTNATITTAATLNLGGVGADANATNSMGLSIYPLAIRNGYGAMTTLAGIGIGDGGLGVSLGNQTATLTNLNAIRLEAITYTSDTLVRTVTNPATLYIGGAPVASTNVTFANTAWALWVDSGDSRFDGNLDVRLDDRGLRVGASTDARFYWSTSDADAEYLNITIGGSRNMIISEDAAIDWGHATQTNPTLWIHSSDATDLTDYINFAHNQTNAVITSGNGAIILDAPSGVQLQDSSVAALTATSDATDATWTAAASDNIIIAPTTAGNLTLNASGTTSQVILQNRTITPGAAYQAVSIPVTFAAENFAHEGLRLTVTQNGANSSTLTGLGVAIVKATDATTLDTATGVHIIQPSVAGTLTNARGVFVDAQSPSPGATITNAYGIDIANQSSTGGTTSYGLRIQSQTANATTTRAIELTGTGVNNAIRLGSSPNLYSSGAEVINFSDSTDARNINFTLTAASDQTISASAGNLALTATAGNDVLIGDNATLVYVDGGVNGGIGGVGIGQVAANGVMLLAGWNAYTMATGTTAARHFYTQGNVTELAGAAITDIVGAYFNTFTIGDGGGAETVGIVSTVYIPDAPTVGTAPTNGPYALFSDAGTNRFDGIIQSGTSINSLDAVATSLVLQNQTFTAGAGHVAVQLTPSWAAENFQHTGLRISATQNGSNSSSLIGFQTGIVQAGAGTLVDGYGIIVAQPSVGSAVTTNRGIRIANQNIGNVIDTSYGIEILNQTGTTTTAYGLYIENADTYSIWVDAGTTRLDGILQQNEAIYFTQTDGNEKIDSAADGYLDYTVTTAHRFNMSAADTDVRLEFIGTTASGLLEWMEDEDYFRFGDSVLFNAGKIQTGADVDIDMSAGGRLYGGGIQANYQTLAANTNLTLDENDSVVEVTTGAGSNNTITLPAASGNQGMIISVYLITDGGLDAVITRAGADVIQNGSGDLANTTVTLNDAGDYALLQCVSASMWQIVSNSGGVVA